MTRCRALHQVLLLGLLLVPAAHLRADDLDQRVREAVRKVDPSIVRLRVIGGEQVIDGEKVNSQVTTGIVVSPDGEILTSQFALMGQPEAILAEFATGQKANARIVAADHVRRLVLLKVNQTGLEPVVAVPPKAIEPGLWSVALGRFYSGTQSSISVGILSAVNRIHGLAIQTDAKISPVNYGGPLISLDGQVFGILVPMSPRGSGSPASGLEWYDSGIGFAVPMTDALDVAARLRNGKDLKPGKLGLRMKAGGMFSASVSVDRVVAGGPADLAGLQPGDRLVSVAGRVISRLAILEDAVAAGYAGDVLTFDVDRSGQKVTADVTLTETLPVEKRGYLGLMTIRTATSEPARVQIPGLQGLMPEQPQPLPRLLPEKKADAPSNTSNEQESDSVPVLCMPGGAAQKAGLPVQIEVVSVNEVATKSAMDLFVALRSLVAAQNVTLGYRLPGSMEVATAKLRADELPLKVGLNEEFLRYFCEAGEAPKGAADSEEKDQPEKLDGGDVERRELTIEGMGRCIVYSSTQRRAVLPGLVILLAAHGQQESEIVAKWKPWLDSHRLTVAVPVNPDQTRLSGVDMPLVMRSIQAITSGSKGDLRRVAVVADRDQADLAWQLNFDGPSPIRGIALTQGWFAQHQSEGFDGAGQSILMLDETQGIEQTTLRDESARRLRDAGFWVPQKDGQPTQEQAIADWLVMLRSL